MGGMGVGEVLGTYLGTVHDVCICLFRCLHAVALDDAFFWGVGGGGGGNISYHSGEVMDEVTCLCHQ